MADNVAITAGSGTSIATDDVVGVHFQKVKLDLGADGASSPVSGSVPVNDNAGSLTVDGTVAVSSLPALVAGTANIGDVDVLTVPAPLSTTGGGTEAAALRVTVANDSTGVVSVDDNGGSLTVDGTVTANAGTGTFGVGGAAAADAAVSGNPVPVGAVRETMSDAAPSTRLSADGDVGYLAQTGDGALFALPTGPQNFIYKTTTSVTITDRPESGG